jgi:hypothetical protein
MPWELTIVNYDGAPPRLYEDRDKSRERPLGTLDEVRQHISDALPGTEWNVEPPLIEAMKATGCDLWKDWDELLIATCSQPTLKAYYQGCGFHFEMYGFGQADDGPIRHILLNVRGIGNPIPALRALCAPKGWCAAEAGCKDAKFLDFDAEEAEWRRVRDYLNQPIQQTTDPNGAEE